MNKTFANFPQLLWVTLCLLCLASCSANPIPDLASLRHQLQKPDPAAIKTIIGNPQDQIDILAVQAGGLWFLAQQQAAAQDWLSASALYRAQLEKGGPVWKGLAWRGWLSSQRSALAWDEIIEQGPGLFAQVEAALTQSTEDKTAAKRELLDSREAWQQAEIEARIQMGQLDQANAAVARALASWPENAVPDWLSLGQAKLGWLQVAASGKGADEAFFRTQYRSLRAVDAQAAHGELWLIAKAVAPRVNPKKNPKLDLILLLLQAKATLAQGQAASALDQMRGLLLPKGKTPKPKLQAIKRQQAQLLEILDSGPGLAFWRDFYNAGRLAGQISGSVSLMDDLRGQIAAKLRQPEPVFAYLYELQGRLLRAKSDHAGAAAAFGKSLDLAFALEGKGKFDSLDRRRVQWYLLRSYTDLAGDQDTPRSFDYRAFGRVAKLADDPAYFDDVLERAVLISGGRQRWADLEWLYKNCAPNMAADLQARCAIVLARVSQLKLEAGDASEKENFKRLSGEALKTPSSLYYQALARWLRAEAINIGDLLGGQAVVRENVASGDWATQVAQAHALLELYDAGMDYVWDLRKEISPARFMALGFAYVDAKRYRQGLRILESARVRLGHPADQSSLGYFYPRPYLELIHRAVDNTSLPEWLMLAMVRTESNFDISANSGAGARGLAQLMPATAKLTAAKLGLEDADLDDPAINLRLGSSYLLDQYKGFGKWPQALAAYNAGLGRTRSWIKSGLPADPILFTELIPVEESRNYVRRIIESGLLYNHLYYGVDIQAVLSLIFQNP